jgi:sugar phosphate isomerase/epimerase
MALNRIARRYFLGAAASLPFASPAPAGPLGLPVGLATYTVRDALARDFMGTLRAVARIGYRKVESYMELNGRDTTILRRNFDSLGLEWDTAHCTNEEFTSSLSKTIERAKTARLRIVITAMPLIPNSFAQVAAGLTLDDWKRNAELFNRIGEQVKRAGLIFGYHNHNADFRPVGGTTGYDTLLKRTDPDLVKLEMDVGWVVAGGHDPVAYLTRFPHRYITLHLKDLTRDFVPNYQFKMTGRPAGQGIMDWKRLFAAARKTDIKGLYVEQEAPYLPNALAAAKASYDFLNRLN